MSTALEARSRLARLHEERAVARAAGLGEVGLYMDDLEAEIAQWRNAYVGAAVTEIASLRAALDGPQHG
jgi:hypothetical protein